MARHKKNSDHVIWSTIDGYLKCFHCGETYKFNACLPASLDMAGAIQNQFLKSHRSYTLIQRGIDLKEAHRQACIEWDKEHPEDQTGVLRKELAKEAINETTDNSP